jgi:hypothetical protein
MSVEGLSALTTCPVLSLEESLVLSLQLLLQDDAAYRFSAVEMTLGRHHVRAVNARVVRELARLRNADVERLTWAARITLSVFFKN